MNANRPNYLAGTQEPNSIPAYCEAPPPSTISYLIVIDTPVLIQGGTVPVDPQRLRGEIRFEAVDFAYAGRSALLQGFDLTVQAGSTLGIVGATGSGKSTVVKLLLRLYERDGGSICLDGVPIETLQLRNN